LESDGIQEIGLYPISFPDHTTQSERENPDCRNQTRQIDSFCKTHPYPYFWDKKGHGVKPDADILKGTSDSGFVKE
jgi:hypothetical protein